MIKFALRFVLSVFFIGFAAPVSQAEQQCPVIPAVQWWDNIDHKSITTYVDARHGGDWDAYMAKWQSHLNQVRAIHAKGGAVASKKLAIRMEGRQLSTYISDVEFRLRVTKCLADAEMAAAAKKLEDLDTASGDEDLLPETVR